MTIKKTRILVVVITGGFIGAVLLDYGVGLWKKSMVPPEERAAIRKMEELYHKTHGHVDEFTPDQYRMMQEFMTTRRVSEHKVLDPSMSKMPDQMRMRRIWRRSGGDWSKMSAEDRAFMKAKLGDRARNITGKKPEPAPALPPYADSADRS